MSDYSLGICNSFVKDYKNYADACGHLNLSYKTVDILSADWIKNVRNSGCNAFLVRPSDDFAERNSVYMERLYFINKVMGLPIYPKWEELFVYENKRTAIEWLDLQGFPHPKSKIFLRKKEALEYVSSTKLPVVVKSRTSAGARGVSIVKSRLKAKYLVYRHFGFFHPKLTWGYYKHQWKWGVPVPLPGQFVRHNMIIQEYEKIRWEWRLIKIGETFSGHQKLVKGEFASGTGLVGWAAPTDELLRLFKNICDKGKFNCMSADILETEDGRFLVNELQPMFGSYRPYQMKIDGKPGRFIYKEGNFVFEEGEFHQFGSCLLRVKDFIRILSDKTE